MRSPPRDFPGEKFWKISVGPKFFETTRTFRDNPVAQKSLFDLMCLHESSQATDPRDKIYGLVGIGVDTQDGHFDINYRISQYGVAIYFANFMIKNTQSLDFLCFPMICLPPFTPSMSYHKYKAQAGNFFRTMGTALTPQNGIELRKYTAAGSARPEARLIPRNKTAYTIFGDGFWLFDTIIRTNLNRMKIEGVPVDEVAAFLDDLT